MKRHILWYFLASALLSFLPRISLAAAAAAPGALTVPTASATGTYTISWVASKTPGVTYLLQESTDATFATPITAYKGLALSKALTGKESGKTYYYRVRAAKTGLTNSDWRRASNGCAVPGTAKSATPGAMVIPLFDGDGAYTVKWAASATKGVKYILEEATNSQFTANWRVAYSGTALSRAITGRPSEAAYYYRVRAVKPGLQDSTWRRGSNGCGVPDTPLARRFLGAALGCGYLSPNTVPDTWGEAALRSAPDGQYCATWVPPFWNSSYLGAGGSFFTDPADTSGVAIMGGIPSGIQECSPRGYANWYIALMSGFGKCANPRVEHYEEGVADFFGTQYATASFVFTCQKGGTSIVAGAYAGVNSGPYGLCSTINLSSWVPANAIEQNACVNAQILSAQKCANVNTKMCDKPVCSNGCKAQGYTSGYCNSFEECVCN